MNKIITINLGGIAIQIEEDAYDHLRNYLQSLDDHFSGTENSSDILTDIEHRISEMLFNTLKAGKVSINTADVDAVIETMGRPSDFDTGVEEEADAFNQSQKAERNRNSSNKKQTKRLFRDPDEAKLGGVCAGVSKYLDVDVSMLRILCLVMLFVFGSGFLVYIVLWIAIPEAKTAAEKLEMKGEVPNIENIKNTIVERAENAYENIKKSNVASKIGSFFQKAGRVLGTLFVAFAKILSVLLVIGILMLLVIAFIKFFIEGGDFSMNQHNFQHGIEVYQTALFHTPGFWISKISWFLVIFVPLMYIIVRLVSKVLDLPKPTKLVKQGVISFWVLTIIVGMLGYLYGFYQVKDNAKFTEKAPINFVGDTLWIQATDEVPKDAMATDRLTNLNVIKANDGQAMLRIDKSCSASGEKKALRDTEKIRNGYVLDRKTLNIPIKVLTTTKSPPYVARVKYTVIIPVGKYVVFDLSTMNQINDIKNIQNVYDKDMAGRTFKMTNSGLRCEDCEDLLSKKSASISGFDRIEIRDAFTVEIIEDGDQRVELPKDGNWEDQISYEIDGNTLLIESKSPGNNALNWATGSNGAIKIHAEAIKELVLNGASNVDMKANNSRRESFEVAMSGASKLNVIGLNADKSTISMEGANNLEIAGNTNIFILEMDGASKVVANKFGAQFVNIDCSGTSTVRIQAEKEITGNIDGASKVRYIGSPKINVDVDGASSIKPAS